MIDFHCDTVYKLWEKDSRESLLKNSFSVDISRLNEIGAKAQCFAIFTPFDSHTEIPFWDRMKAIHERFVFELEKAGDAVKQATRSSDMSDDRVSAVLTIEDLGPIEGRMDRFEEVLSWRPRIASLTWNLENEYGYPNSSDPAIMEKGLKKKGFEILERMKEEDLICDVSHLNDGGFWDVVNSGVKVVATHSNSRSITDCTRNLTDEMIRAIADRGGIVGLNFCPPFLSSYPEGTPKAEHYSRICDMITHIRHIYEVAGEDVLALGTDFDGIGGTLEIPGVECLPMLRQAMEDAGFSSSVVEKFWQKNGIRVLE